MDSLRNAIEHGRNLRQVQVSANHGGGARKSQNAPAESQLTAHPRHHAPEDRVTLSEGLGGLRYHEINGRRFYH